MPFVAAWVVSIVGVVVSTRDVGLRGIYGVACVIGAIPAFSVAALCHIAFVVGSKKCQY